MRNFILLFSVLLLFTSCLPNKRESGVFPSREMTVIVPFSRGGGTDMVARALSRRVEKIIGYPVKVENILGGSGATGLIAGAAAVPDGYTVTMVTRELVSLPAVGVAQITKDDFKLLALVNRDPALMAVPTSSAYKSPDEIMRAAEQFPGRIRFASAAKPHFYILELEYKTGLNFNKIPYNGAAESIPGLIAGDSDFTLANPGELKPWLDKKMVRPLALMAAERSSFLPQVPTFHELGYELYSSTWRGMGVPARTSPEIIDKLESIFAQAVTDPVFRVDLQVEHYTAEYLDAENFRFFVEDDQLATNNLVENLNILVSPAR